MSIGKNDWAFKVNDKTMGLTMSFPKRKKYTPQALGNVAIGLMRMCGAIGIIWDEMLKNNPKQKGGRR